MTPVFTDPTNEPVSLAELKAELKITHTVEDALLQRDLNAAIGAVQKKTNRSIAKRTITVYIKASEIQGSEAYTGGCAYRNVWCHSIRKY